MFLQFKRGGAIDKMDKQTEKYSDPDEEETKRTVLDEEKENNWRNIVDESNEAVDYGEKYLVHSNRSRLYFLPFISAKQ